MKRILFAHLTALAFVLVAGAGVQAGPIPAGQLQWTYNFSPGAPAVYADGNPSAGVTFTNEPTKTATGSSDVVATNLRVFSAAMATAPDHLTTNGSYSLNLTLTMTDSHGVHTANFHFTGKLSGTFSSENANVSNAFGPLASQSINLGVGNTYKFTVALVSYTPPGPPDQANAGSISAHVTVASNARTIDTPEPGTLLLSGMGLTFLGGAAWRRRRRMQSKA
jgi:hypothetical protein